jgi:hypothetical protein
MDGNRDWSRQVQSTTPPPASMKANAIANAIAHSARRENVRHDVMPGLRRWCVALVIPDCVAIAMEMNDLRVLRQRIDFHHECGGPEDFFAGVALLPVAWTSEDLRCAVAWKTTICELRADEKADGVRVHSGLTCGDSLDNAAPTRVSTQRKAGVRAGGR